MDDKKILQIIEKLLDLSTFEVDNRRVLTIISNVLSLHHKSEPLDSNDDIWTNNLVEFMWEDEQGNGIYKFKN